MSDPNGWPDPSRPGVPLHPERSGWHWLRRADGFVAPYRWTPGKITPTNGFWLYPPEWELMPEDREIIRQTYCGPCLLPEEVAALVAAARREGAEAMRDACARTAVSAPTNEPMGGPRTDLRSGIYAAIRALPLPDADDHLGIPAATLAGLRDGSLVAAPRAIESDEEKVA